VNGHLVLSFKNKTGRQEFKDKKKGQKLSEFVLAKILYSSAIG
jgi:hypothetical protein